MATSGQPDVNLDESQQPQIIAIISATWTIAVIAVGLRFLSRRLSKAGWWIDDYLILPALALTTVLCWLSMTWGIEYNLGRHLFALPQVEIPKAVEVFLKTLVIAEVCYVWVTVAVKFSLLAFYWRVFSCNRFVRWSVIALSVVTASWGTAVFLIVVLQCRPLRGFWDPSVGAYCPIDTQKFCYGNAIPNIITDAALMLIPLPAIWALQLSRKQKVLLIMVFLVGIFVTAVSIIRLYHLVTLDGQDPDLTWTYVAPALWTMVEQNVAIVCGCLPQLGPMLRFAWEGATQLTSRMSSHQDTNVGSTGSESEEMRKLELHHSTHAMISTNNGSWHVLDEGRCEGSHVLVYVVT